jgi:hypothetical protein
MNNLDKQYAVFEKVPAHGKDTDGIILGPYKSKEEAELAGQKYGYNTDNYYIKEFTYEQTR